ncbi:helix-turn-helix domain-containing protein [Paenibacillus mendelii]|uniref:Helix-turn-helix domain-containing protein n=1 Tax=Paenibacillus mendelii TaxID=206163 RepID=A0ABV6JKI9_9BACL|nr:helix-turn-helix domain-containing protein [Paenibacillus mendelii]MCQ6563048.1 helix-turn-helix domain-containing protein [Paenibacillus mendelii]
MKRKLNNSRLFYQFLLSHVLIFAIPFTILSGVVYYNAVVRFKSEIETSNVYKLNQVKNTFDLLVRGLDNTASRISIDRHLTPFMVRSGIYNEMEAVEELSKYKVNNTIVDEVALYFHGDRQLYSSIGMNSFDTFTERIYRFSDIDGDRLAKEMSELQLPEIRRIQTYLSGSDQKQNMLLYMFPIPRNSQSPYGTVSFIIRESVMTDLVGPILGDFNGSVYISDANGRILASRSRENNLTEQNAINEMSRHNEEGIYNATIGGERYSLMQAKSDLTGWSYVIAMPTSQFLDRVLEMRTFILLICSAVVAFGILIAVLLSTRQYRPIRSIAEYARSLQGRSPAIADRRHNELDLIRDSVHATRDLMEQINHQRPIVREQFFVRLLVGSIKDSGEITAFMARENMTLPGESCFVAVIPTDGYEHISTQSREELLRMLSEVALPGAVGYGVEMIQDNVIAILIVTGCDVTAMRETQEESAREIVRLFEQCWGIRPTVGIGNPVSGMPLVNRSYIEASAAMEANARGRRGGIVFFDELSEWQESNEWYSVEEQIRMVQSMKQGNKEAARTALATIMSDLQGKDVSLFYLRCMCFDLINTFLRTMNELKLNIQQEHRRNLIEFSTLKQLNAGMDGLIDDICDYVQANKESKSSALGADILHYIGQHYNEYDLNLEKIADHFRMSLSYFSRFMKDQTGYTFTDYVTHLRMEEVKRQLKSSDLPIKNIVTSVGYSDVSNFMRKFKNTEGLTLGQYRKLHS